MVLDTHPLCRSRCFCSRSGLFNSSESASVGKIRAGIIHDGLFNGEPTSPRVIPSSLLNWKKKALLKTTCSVLLFFVPFTIRLKKDVQYIGFIKKRTFDFPRVSFFFLLVFFSVRFFNPKKRWWKNSHSEHR